MFLGIRIVVAVLMAADDGLDGGEVASSGGD